METSTEMVKYSFSQQELVDLSREHARYYNELKSVDEQLVSIKADFKNRTTKLEVDMSHCGQRVTSGYEMRSIRCLMLKARPDNESLLIVRLDNGRILKRRRMNADERQIVLSDAPSEILEFEVDLSEDADYAVVLEDVLLTRSEAKELGAVDGLIIRGVAKKLESA